MQIQSIIILWTCENKNRWLFAIIVFYRNIRKNNWTKMSMLNVWSFHRIQIRDISNICGKIFEQCFFKIYVNLISKCIIIFIMIWNVYSYSVLKVIKLSSFSFFFFIVPKNHSIRTLLTLHTVFWLAGYFSSISTVIFLEIKIQTTFVYLHVIVKGFVPWSMFI
jgi:hypothetical protein